MVFELTSIGYPEKGDGNVSFIELKKFYKKQNRSLSEEVC